MRPEKRWERFAVRWPNGLPNLRNTCCWRRKPNKTNPTEISFVFVAAAGRDNDELPGAICPDVGHWGGYAARWGFDRSSLVGWRLLMAVEYSPTRCLNRITNGKRPTRHPQVYSNSSLVSGGGDR